MAQHVLALLLLALVFFGVSKISRLEAAIQSLGGRHGTRVLLSALNHSILEHTFLFLLCSLDDRVITP